VIGEEIVSFPGETRGKRKDFRRMMIWLRSAGRSRLVLPQKTLFTFQQNNIFLSQQISQKRSAGFNPAPGNVTHADTHVAY